MNEIKNDEFVGYPYRASNIVMAWVLLMVLLMMGGLVLWITYTYIMWVANIEHDTVRASVIFFSMIATFAMGMSGKKR